ncbi:MAG: glutamine-hydrolyzing carbamoyl-phosphate synthase small subunit [Desulfovibrionaceae bacterium]|nr:glutamine-hydrolyzing carbamoyl-phosphate synthase small subunit [Desulfovibrionaceae bacterium]
MKPALLMLDDGTCFEGLACGAEREAAGEVVFTTGMCGYQEILTDPSSCGQILAFTAAHLGNYGTNAADDQSPAVRAEGAVFHDLFACAEHIPFPHWRAEASLNHRLLEDGVTGIHGVDTRALTLHLREHGARKGLISALDLDRPSLLRRAGELPPVQGRDLAAKAWNGSVCTFALDPAPAADPTDKEPGGRIKVAVLDFGLKRALLTQLRAYGMEAVIFPGNTPAKDLLAQKPDGLLLSNGPGDPEPCGYAVRAIRDLLGRLPILGICLGHLLLGLAKGGRTYKLPFGHRGQNHPVREILSGRVRITSQNHGFSLDPDSLPAELIPTHWNLNDNTLEGMAFSGIPALSVQYHPETVPGGRDAHSPFARFREIILDSRGDAGRKHA